MLRVASRRVSSRTSPGRARHAPMTASDQPEERPRGEELLAGLIAGDLEGEPPPVRQVGDLQRLRPCAHAGNPEGSHLLGRIGQNLIDGRCHFETFGLIDQAEKQTNPLGVLPRPPTRPHESR